MNDAAASSAARPRWLHFGLKSLLLLMLLLSAYFAGRVPLQQRIRQLERERAEQLQEIARQRESIAFRRAEKAAQVAEAELRTAMEISRLHPGAISDSELTRLEAALELAKLEVAQALLPPPPPKR